MSARNSREAKAARRAERDHVLPAAETRIGVCRGCGGYTECHADSRLCKSCLVADTEAESDAMWAADLAELGKLKALV